MLSRTSEYALRATIYLAQHETDWPIPGRRIAEQAEIPPKYLSKILGDLVRSRVLESFPGKTGGFRLRRPARQTRLLEVLSPFEQFEHRRCPFGNQECGNEQPCLAHDRWNKVIETQERFLEETSVHDVAFSRAAPRGKARKKRKR